jgi:hypothetical protein
MNPYPDVSDDGTSNDFSDIEGIGGGGILTPPKEEKT